MLLDNMPLLEGLEAYKKENILRFHMPGHFGKSSFTAAQRLSDNLFQYDVTEVEGTDNLCDPTGMIKDAMDKLKNAYNSEKSFMLINGSTSGVYAMIDAVTKHADTIIVARNCHKSISNIVELKELKVDYVYPEINLQLGLDEGYSLDEIKRVVKQSPNAVAVVLTHPNFWGFTCDLTAIAEFLHKNGKYLLIDEAHGAHLAFNDKLPKSSLYQGADMVVQSTHKMLPALTQTAILHCKKGMESNLVAKVERSVERFLSSSPSYILMASIDIARAFMEAYGRVLIDELYEDVIKARNRYKDCKEVSIVMAEDFCKLVIHTKLPAEIVDGILRSKYQIQSEMALGSNLMFILGMGHPYDHICKIIDSTISIVKVHENQEIIQKANITFPKLEKKFEIYEGIDKLTEIIDLGQCEGRVCAKRVTPFPPGIPLILEGEVYNKEVIDIIKRLNLQKEVIVYE